MRKAYNNRFRYIMIDEYQDTNRSQYELVRLLTAQHSNVAVAGDEDQSIYGWRGADIRNILDFERDYPNARVIRLEQNYRSAKTILEAASALVANNKARKGKWLWTESGSGEPVQVYEAPDSENEALFIADTTDKLLARDPKLRVAVLYRTNFQSRAVYSQISTRTSSRTPFTPGYSTSDGQDITGSQEGARINVLSDPYLPPSERTFDRNFRTEAFGRPAQRTFGNAGVNIMRNPSWSNWDMSFSKRFPLASEQRFFQLRGEFYNIWNHTQFNGYNTTARFNPAGQQINAAFGQLNSTRDPRKVQFSLPFMF